MFFNLRLNRYFTSLGKKLDFGSDFESATFTYIGHYEAFFFIRDELVPLWLDFMRKNPDIFDIQEKLENQPPKMIAKFIIHTTYMWFATPDTVEITGDSEQRKMKFHTDKKLKEKFEKDFIIKKDAVENFLMLLQDQRY